MSTTRLDPVGRVRLPRRTTLLRATLVAALLLTAAGVLYSGGTDDRAAGVGASTSRTATPAAASWLPDIDEPEHPPGGGADTDAGEGARQPIPDGMVGVPVPLAEPAALAVLRPGDRVDLLSVSAAGGDPVAIAADAAVLAVDRASAAVLLSLTEEQARAVLATPAATGFAVVVRP